jgi:uncharacterized protein YgiM (DUF1202 family)
MAVKIGHSSIDENGRIAGGQSGDQTGKEVCIRDWYDKNWDYVIRCNDPAIAEKIAASCEAACNNANVGYDQNQRNSLYLEALKVNMDLSKVGKCECDCSSLASICCVCAGIPAEALYIGGNMRTTRNIKDALVKTGKFTVFTDASYAKSDKKLKRGDIICKAGSHVIIVLSNGSEVSAPAPAPAPKPQPAPAPAVKRERATAKTTMNLREGSSTNHKVIGYVKKGNTVNVLEKLNNGWMKVDMGGKIGYVSNAGGKYFDMIAVAENPKSFKVKITASALNVRAGVGTAFRIKGVVHKNDICEIIEECNNWGKLASGLGWISLKYATRV